MTVRHCLRTLLVAAVAGAFVAGVGALPSQAAEKVRWRVAAGFPTRLPALGDTAPWVVRMLNKSSDGDIQLNLYEPGRLVPAFQITEAVSDGEQVDAGYTWIGYDTARIPAAPLLAGAPFGFEPWEYMAWWHHGGGQALAEEVYDAFDIHPILCGIIGPDSAGWFRNEIASLDDLNGLKIRFAGLGSKVLQKLGASVTMLPVADIYRALEEGAIDASESSLPEVDQTLGLGQIVKNNYFPGWQQTFTAMHILVNGKVWRETSDQDQAMITMGCMAGTTYGLSKSEANQGPVIADYKDAGVTPRQVPQPVLAELYRVTQEVLEEEAAADKMFRTIWESQKAFHEDYALWKRQGYLPRDFEDRVIEQDKPTR
ncbi:MAG: TRAP transporter substrate-binding protein [Rhodospirillales bacterium]|nr:TRAP transporter substrate-binding protein [Rhodospirillales bacterium]